MTTALTPSLRVNIGLRGWSLLLSGALLAISSNKASAQPITCLDYWCPPPYECRESPQGPYCFLDPPCRDVQCPPGYICENLDPGVRCIPDPATTGVPSSGVGDSPWLGSAYPNPSRGDVSMGFALARTSPGSLRIYDITGHAIRSLIEVSLPAGVHTVTWDRRSTSGAPVRPGLYFCELRVGAQKLARRVALIR